MTDKELLLFLINEFRKREKDSKVVGELLFKLSKEVAVYEDAHLYSIELGNLIADSFGQLTEAMLPNGTLDRKLAEQILEPLIKEDYRLISDFCVSVQNDLNKQARIGMKAVEPWKSESRVHGICKVVAEQKTLADATEELRETVTNYGQHIVDDAVRRNAESQYKAGMSPKIVRTVAGGCCEWCSKLAGTYDYSEVSNSGNDVYRRHRNCRCMVSFVPARGKRQNVHSKKWQ